MKANFYLIIEGKRKSNYANDRRLGTIRVSKGKPSTGADEIALSLNLDIPDALFAKPTLEASIKVPDKGQHGPVITAEVCENIAAIIKEQTGITLNIRAPEAAPSDAQ